MFGGWKNQRRSPIGLDLGTHSVRMIQLERGRDGAAKVAAAAARALPADLPASGPERVKALAAILREMLAAGGFSGAAVVSCLPASAVQYKNLRMPKMPPDELAGAIQWEAADRLKLNAETAQVQFFDAGEVRQGEEARQEIILLAAQRSVVDQHLEALLQAGLKPLAIDVVPGALARSLGGKPGSDLEAKAAVVLDVGYVASKVLICQNGRVVFFKLIEIGGRRFDQAVAEALKLQVAEAAVLRRQACEHDDASADPGAAARREALTRGLFDTLRAAAADLAKELSLCLRYYGVTFRGTRPETVLLAGGESNQPLLARVLSEGTGLHVELARPFEGIACEGVPALKFAAPAAPGTTPAPGDQAAGQGEWSVAMGLALRWPERNQKRGAA